MFNLSNFYPYFEACEKLSVDTKYVYKEIGEPSVQKTCTIINPNLKCSRNYQNIRLYCDFYEEYIELKH